jgi:CheY-like chemotaxis protein
MGGKIWVESEPWHGSAFHFTARFGIPKKTEIHPNGSLLEAKPESTRPLDILLVEDNIVNQKLAVRLLEKMGDSVTVASNGKEALQILASKRFDLALMDVQMPELDGFETTQVIRRAEARTGEHLPIIAMTAYAMAGDREKCLASGMDGYLSKPIKVRELAETLQFYRRAAEDAAAQP